jgi:sugar-specific transcriptional regulator TrmB
MSGHLARQAINRGLNIHHTQIYKVVKSVNNEGIIETHDGKKYKLTLQIIKDDTSTIK